jgi:hypothetical protein
VLTDSGNKVLVVLDDVLAYSDSQRMRNFAPILSLFAQHFQIFLLSCDWTRWQALFEELSPGAVQVTELSTS